jgi:hypothetical protein
VTALLQGSKGVESIIGIAKCSLGDWSVFLMYAVAVVSVAVIGSKMARNEEKRKEKCGWEFSVTDKRWTVKRVVTANFLAPVVGMIASAAGLGGGVSLNPILFAFEFEPVVISGTSMFIIMVSKLTASILYMLAGNLPIGYWLFIGVWLTLATVISTFQLKAIMAKLGRQSLIAFLFVAFMSIALVLTLYVGYTSTMRTLEEEKPLMEFSGYCDSG